MTERHLEGWSGRRGLRRTRWEELPLVADHRAYLDDPGRYLRHLLA